MWRGWEDVAGFVEEGEAEVGVVGELEDDDLVGVEVVVGGEFLPALQPQRVLRCAGECHFPLLAGAVFERGYSSELVEVFLHEWRRYRLLTEGKAKTATETEAGIVRI